MPNLGTALAEFRRVVRPGGLVAVKETDVSMYRIVPAPPGLILRWNVASAANGNITSAGMLRAAALPGWLRRAGLLEVWQRSTLIEHSVPFSPAVRTGYRDLLGYLAALAPELDLPDADQDVWRQWRDPAALERFLDDPDGWLLECNVLTVGTVPSRPGPSV